MNFKVPQNCVNTCIEYLQNNNTIYHPIALENSHFYVVATVKDMDQLALAKESIKRLSSIADVETSLWIGIRNIPENLQLLSSFQDNLFCGAVKRKSSCFKLDNLDHQIIDGLARDGCKPFSTLASELDVSTSTIIRKYEKLRDNGVLACSIQVDPFKLGYRAAVILDLAFFSKSSLTEIVNRLSEIPDVYLVIQTSGVYDLSIFSMVKDVEQLFRLKNVISEIAEVSRFNMYLRHPKTHHPWFMEQITTI